MAHIRKAIFEYIGTDQDMDLFLESAIRDYYGARPGVSKPERVNFVGNVENDANTDLSRFVDSY